MTHTTVPSNRWYTEAFTRGAISRKTVNALAHAMPTREGDAFLAGYYEAKRKARFEADLEAVDMERGYCVWTKP